MMGAIAGIAGVLIWLLHRPLRGVLMTATPLARPGPVPYDFADRL
jgi:hypothetical protein